MQQSSILIIYTGGTIGMMHDPVTGALHPFNFENIHRQIPTFDQLHCEIVIHSLAPLLDSSNMNPSAWTRIAEIIGQYYEDYDGFVVLHGTDTMAYTASALSFMLENLNKPVIFTGSQLPLGMIRTDGRENFITAIEIASAREDDTPIVPEVAIYFENTLYRGNRTTKVSAEHFDAFFSGNYPFLAEAGIHITYTRHVIAKPNFKRLKVHSKLDTNIAILKIFPGISEQMVTHFLSMEGLQAVVLETYGSGNAPTEPWFLRALEEAIGRGVIVLNVTQCKGGTVDMGLYETSVELRRIGVTGGYDITTESAVAKLMYLLGRGCSHDETQQLLQTPLRGEMTV